MFKTANDLKSGIFATSALLLRKAVHESTLEQIVDDDNLPALLKAKDQKQSGEEIK